MDYDELLEHIFDWESPTCRNEKDWSLPPTCLSDPTGPSDDSEGKPDCNDDREPEDFVAAN